MRHLSFFLGALNDPRKHKNNTIDPNQKTLREIGANFKLYQMINSIKSDKNWYESVVQKASNSNISIDSMLIIDAQYMLDLELNK